MIQVSHPKIAVVGAGAVGSVLGGLLARAGKDVTLIGRKAHAEAINQHGLFIDGVLGEFTVSVKAAETLTSSPDLLLLTVKTQDIEEACQAIKPYVNKIPIVTLQNGVRSDELTASILGKEHIISGVVCFNARFLKAGKVRYGPEGSLLLGEAFGENGQRAQDIRDILNKAVRTEVRDNIQGVHWTKLFLNLLGNSLEAMTGLSIGECIRYAGVRRIGISILKEALFVVNHAGISLESIPGFPILAFITIIKSPLPLASAIIAIMMHSDQYKEIVTSTLQSLHRGRPTEIDYLNGEITGLGKNIGLQTPYNSKVVEVVHKIENTGEFYSPDALKSLFSVCAKT